MKATEQEHKRQAANLAALFEVTAKLAVELGCPSQQQFCELAVHAFTIAFREREK